MVYQMVDLLVAHLVEMSDDLMVDMRVFEWAAQTVAALVANSVERSVEWLEPQLVDLMDYNLVDLTVAKSAALLAELLVCD